MSFENASANHAHTHTICSAVVDVTVGFLMQVDKLVQLLESPIFIRECHPFCQKRRKYMYRPMNPTVPYIPFVFLDLRLQLLEPTDPQHPFLLKSLYGILMLLPQSVAFKILRDRLESVSSLTVGMGVHSQDRSSPKGGKKASEEYAALLSHFEMVQASHAEARRQALKTKSLLAE
jgi:vacuole morphology and inheritance protein 14